MLLCACATCSIKLYFHQPEKDPSCALCEKRSLTQVCEPIDARHGLGLAMSWTIDGCFMIVVLTYSVHTCDRAPPAPSCMVGWSSSESLSLILQLSFLRSSCDFMVRTRSGYFGLLAQWQPIVASLTNGRESDIFGSVV